jgi:hypothetical protein
MFPQRGEALDHTIRVEAAVSDLYAEALRRWSPTASAAVLPALTAATLPPDPQALAQTQSVWEQHAEEIVLAGMAVLWAVAAYEAAKQLGEIPAEAAAASAVGALVLGIVLASLLIPEQEVLEAVAYVDNTPALAAARDDFLAVKRVEVSRTTLVVQSKVEAALAKLEESAPEPPPVKVEPEPADKVPDAVADGDTDTAPSRPAPTRPAAPSKPAKDEGRPAAEPPRLTVTIIPEDRPEVLRARAAEVMQPASTEMRDVARNEGYQAAGVLNHAVVAAAVARNVDIGEDLQKCWIATLDAKTRATHWASDGARVPIASTFTVGAAQLAFPGDPSGPPEEVRNCRCRIGILAADEELPDEVDRHTERLEGRDSVVINRDGRTQAEEIRRRADQGNVRARDDPEGKGTVASGGWTAPSEQEITLMNGTKTTTLAADGGADEETYLTFTDALFAVTGTPTSDGRMLAADIELTFRDTPLPLQWCKENEGGHFGSVTVGVIEKITFTGGEVRASGYMLNNDEAVEAVDLVSHGVCNPSVDLANCRIIATDTDGVEVTEETYVEGMDVFATMTQAEVIATTLVATPAFGQTRFALNEQREPRAKSLVASAADSFQPRVYDPAMFADPKLTGPTRLTITKDGHIFGHVACWGEKHRSIQCRNMEAPRSKSGYRHFHTSQVHLSEGAQLAVGRLTVGTGHADVNLDFGPAAEHYDNTGACFALVRAYEDQFGIVVSGVAAPWATPEQIEMGLSAPLSGDWRWIDGSYELVAALSVNTPGFVVRTDPTGAPRSLVASLGPSARVEAGGVSHLTVADIKAIVVEGVAEANRRAALAELAQTVFAEARELVGPPPPVLSVAEQMDALLGEHV